MTKRIFISGVAGFLGSHLADHMLALGHEVVGNDNMIGGYPDNVPDGVEFEQLDCNSPNLTKLMSDVDIVYHCAATAYEGLSVFSPYLISQNNYMATVRMASAAAENEVDRFVFTSSMARYGTNQVPFKEEMVPKPQDPYAVSKFASELLVSNMAESFDFEYVIGVPHNIIGPRQKYDDPYRNVASIFINRMLQGKQPIIYGDGSQMRCFSFVNDTVGSLAKLGLMSGINKEIFNIGPDEEFITINTLAETIAEIIDFELSPIYMKARPQEVYLANCSADKARKILNYKTSYTLKEGLQEMVDWIKQKGAKPFEYHLDLEIVHEKTPSTWKDKLM